MVRTELTASGRTTYNFDANGNETGNSAGINLSYKPEKPDDGHQ